MSEVAHNTPQEFWRPPVAQSGLASSTEACQGCVDAAGLSAMDTLSGVSSHPGRTGPFNGLANRLLLGSGLCTGCYYSMDRLQRSDD